MPHVPTMPPATRFFARVDRFEAECPNCGRIIATQHTRGRELPHDWRRDAQGYRRPRIKQTRRRLIWNPVSQRLACPWCQKTYLVGLLLYPVTYGMWRLMEPPPDAVPDRRQYAEIRRRAQGWYRTMLAKQDQEVNLVVDGGCRCQDGELEDARCPVHGRTSRPGEAKGTPDTSF